MPETICPEAAKCTLLPVGTKDPLPKSTLVQPVSHGGGYVSPAGIGPCVRNTGRLLAGLPFRQIIYRHLENQAFGFVTHNKHRPRYEILARDNPVEIDKRDFPKKGHAKSCIIAMLRIGPTVTVTNQPVRAEAVIIRAFRALWLSKGEFEGAIWA